MQVSLSQKFALCRSSGSLGPSKFNFILHELQMQFLLLHPRKSTTARLSSHCGFTKVIFFFKWMEKREKEMIRRIKLYCLYIFFPIILPKMEGSLTFSSNFFSVSYHWRFFFFLKKITMWKVRIITFHILPILPPFLLWVFLLLWPKFFTWSQTLCLWHHSGCCGGDYDVQSQKG